MNRVQARPIPAPMKTNSFRQKTCALALMLFSIAGHLAAQTGATGTVEGRVFNSRTGGYVERARVSVDGTPLEAFTTTGGFFQLTRVPAGEVRLHVFFTGFAPQTESLTVAAGATARRDFHLGSEIVQLANFVVTSSKEMDGAAIAINAQRFASNIVNVVPADEFGAVLENNVGDFLKFMPGITIDFIGGAARSISMGGVPLEYVPITVGGFDVSTVSGGGTTRS
ncbi:MAG: TonB-dependent receptor [Opitutus sp.]|nr:TonB-dependent receptor [Opitutus sp.]